jgi:hypothetical protein
LQAQAEKGTELSVNLWRYLDQIVGMNISVRTKQQVGMMWMSILLSVFFFLLPSSSLFFNSIIAPGRFDLTRHHPLGRTLAKEMQARMRT